MVGEIDEQNKEHGSFATYMGAAQAFLKQRAYTPDPNAWGKYSKNPWCNLSKKQYKKMKQKRKIEKQTRKKNRGKK